MPQVVAQNRIDFAFTRMVPCTAGAAEQTCVEIVIRTAPDKVALDRLIADYNAQPAAPGRINDHTASTEARIVTDPATLLPLAREERVYWYASFGKGKGDTVLQSEHLVSTTNYDAD